jgi:hypothetical protein
MKQAMATGKSGNGSHSFTTSDFETQPAKRLTPRGLSIFIINTSTLNIF